VTAREPITGMVIGIDPGPVTGVVALRWGAQLPDVRPVRVQVDPGAGLLLVLDAMLSTRYSFRPLLEDGDPSQPCLVTIAIEKFVVGTRSARSGSPQAGELTRHVIGMVLARYGDLNTRIVQRPMVEISRWASDRRLTAAGLLLTPKTVWQHAQSAAKHALFAAVQDMGLPDPLLVQRAARRPDDPKSEG
jgi:hypothetical protein